MEQRLAAVFASSRTETVTKVCADLGISRQTYYLYRRRFAAEGLAGLVPHSRAPLRSPTRTDELVVELVVWARKQLEVEGWDNGAISIRHRLLFDGEQPPSARTVHRVLVRAGLVEPDPKKPPRSSYRRFVFPATTTADRSTCSSSSWPTEPRPQWRCSSSSTITPATTWLTWPGPERPPKGCGPCLTVALARYGAPQMVLSDNGLAFTGHHHGRRVQFERNLEPHRV